MAGIHDRLPVLLSEQLEDLPSVIKNAKDPLKDKNGSASSMAAAAHRFVGVAQYVVNHDITAFRVHLWEAAQARVRLIERFEKGEPISPSYVTMLNYKAIFNALAGGHIELAKSIASRVGGRHEIETKHDHPFDYALGYALRAFALGEQEGMKLWATEFATVCRARENVDFQGYAQAFQGILNKDADMVKNALKEIVKGHARQSKGKGVFKDSEDEELCIWGIGIANLSRAFGLSLDGEHPLIPNELLH